VAVLGVAASSQEWSAARIPGATLKVLTKEQGGAHFPFFESPEHFADVLMDFLKSVG
jgi:pimeloyl-ACP methyl ester carboxylesterase